MAYFDFTINNFKNNETVAKAFIESAKNYDPTGILKPLRTSASLEPGKKSLTTWNVADILQNNLTFKPQGLAYTQFNEQSSVAAQKAYSLQINQKTVVSNGTRYLASYDVNASSKYVVDLAIGGTFASLGTQNSSLTSSGRPAPPSSGFILTGDYRFPTHKTHYANPDGTPKEDSGTKAMDIGHFDGAPVFSPWDGRVAYIGYPEGGLVKSGATKDVSGGNAIVIVGDNGWSIYMCHFNNPPLVDVGSRVSKGQNIAHVGATGRASGPHVHVAVANSTNFDAVWKDPIDYLWDFMKSLETQANEKNVN